MNSSPMVVDNSLHCSDGTVGKTLPVSGSLHWVLREQPWVGLLEQSVRCVAREGEGRRAENRK